MKIPERRRKISSDKLNNPDIPLPKLPQFEVRGGIIEELEGILLEEGQKYENEIDANVENDEKGEDKDDEIVGTEVMFEGERIDQFPEFLTVLKKLLKKHPKKVTPLMSM